ncbi:MAG TPA: tetraacyldisaccharide 4'-kinase [Patescibacteria group bacterium]|nr:tetraacyldisaccharide 4'-kinase [Patescibacteria group bacterium]
MSGREHLVSWLAPLAPLYGGAVALRNLLYERGIFPAHHLSVPVLSVGNLTTGGTGKTPMVAMVAGLLARRGARPVIVSRGYGGSNDGGARVVSRGNGALAGPTEVGDEPVMLAGLCDGVPVIVSRRRRDGGELAVSMFQAGCVILDDGFQHRALARDLDILLLDGVEPFGNGRLLPAGHLREPLSSMSRAGAIVITRSDLSGPGALEAIARQRDAFCARAPVFHARTRPVAVVDAALGDVRPLESLRGARTVCFAGIAHPERFFRDAEAAGCMVVETIRFPDHHRFSDAELSRVAAAAAAARADIVLTTEKDLSRMADAAASKRIEPLLALRVEMSIDEDTAFASLLLRAVP